MKNTCTTKFVDGGFQVVAEVPKKVTWNAEQMEQIVKNMPEDKRKAIAVDFKRKRSGNVRVSDKEK